MAKKTPVNSSNKNTQPRLDRRRFLEGMALSAGAVSMLALVNDRAKRVTLVLDRVLSEAEAVQCHPLVNTATLVIEQGDLRRFLDAIEHVPRVQEVPAAR